MIAWASVKTIRRKVAEVPVANLYAFAAAHPEACRKFGVARNATMLINSAAVARAIEESDPSIMGAGAVETGAPVAPVAAK